MIWHECDYAPNWSNVFTVKPLKWAERLISPDGAGSQCNCLFIRLWLVWGPLVQQAIYFFSDEIHTLQSRQLLCTYVIYVGYCNLFVWGRYTCSISTSILCFGFYIQYVSKHGLRRKKKTGIKKGHTNSNGQISP